MSTISLPDNSALLAAKGFTFTSTVGSQDVYTGLDNSTLGVNPDHSWKWTAPLGNSISGTSGKGLNTFLQTQYKLI